MQLTPNPDKLDYWLYLISVQNPILQPIECNLTACRYMKDKMEKRKPERKRICDIKLRPFGRSVKNMRISAILNRNESESSQVSQFQSDQTNFHDVAIQGHHSDNIHWRSY